ncbi:DNA helicase [Acetobacter sp. AN02]|uniref:helicase-related protein n=1 Tax=Acetobacter sp. AN02 TaxID=2894186 RepID=UPI00243442DD|nr:helicase-related protein [Acetobacter sp. AN02]MDG6094670.1 DNA helicase [Acetobacter sp. AN02]
MKRQHVPGGDRPLVRAILGPTNTGKTHLALERMLSHSSGIIGFPLRLLARENYDRMVSLKGADHVALITGEEKIIPPKARWFSCTTEAMPSDRSVSFLAVDEIQLCADPDRGHIFTDRLLNARGRDETLFLGAETIAPLMRRLIPGVDIETRPRLSALTCAGRSRLARLPARSAIVAFSTAEIYAIAELIRSRRGGCAVVMGQMSPRTRNAQVALYQNREVDYLVATDAIGMGLNMDISHVAFAGLSKFDGHLRRDLTAAEIGQIAGRAGRGTKDGTFGTAGTCPPLSDAIIEAVETHHFDPVSRLSWRNARLDFTSPRALLASLSRPPPDPCLQAGAVASDVLTLLALNADPDIISLADSRARTELLWEICQIPDFRKLGERHHAQFCGRIFPTLARGDHLQEEWLDTQISALTRTDGDVDTLMQRLAGIRIWSYVTARENWVRNAPFWQDRARAAEDQLSDALHERLTARFVDRRAAHLIRKLDEEDGSSLLSAVRADGSVLIEGHPIGRMEGFGFTLHDSVAKQDEKLLMRVARRAVASEIPRQAARCCAAPDEDFSLDMPARLISWNGTPLARVRRGHDVLHPEAELLQGLPDNVPRERLQARLRQYLRTTIDLALPALTRLPDATHTPPVLRGLLHRLREGLGFAEDPESDRRDKAGRTYLRRAGIHSGNGYAWIPALIRPDTASVRVFLLTLGADHPHMSLSLPHPGTVSVPAEESRENILLGQLGWVRTGPVRLRVDISARLVDELRRITASGPTPLTQRLASLTGAPPAQLAAVFRSLGYQLAQPAPLPPGHVGPPAPAMISRMRKADRHPPRNRQYSGKSSPGMRASASSPFAGLAALLRGETVH